MSESGPKSPHCPVCYGTGYFPGFSNTVLCVRGCKPPKPDPQALDLRAAVEAAVGKVVGGGK